MGFVIKMTTVLVLVPLMAQLVVAPASDLLCVIEVYTPPCKFLYGQLRMRRGNNEWLDHRRKVHTQDTGHRTQHSHLWPEW